MNHCDMCKSELTTTSTDMWIHTTMYEEDGEVRKTGEAVEGVDSNDYVMFCPTCTPIATEVWNKMLLDLMERNYPENLGGGT